LRTQKVTKKVPEPRGSGPPAIHPGFFEGLRHPGLSPVNMVLASDGARYFSSLKRSGARLHP